MITNIFVIATDLFHELLECEKLLIAFGIGLAYHFIDVYVMSSVLGSEHVQGFSYSMT